MQRKTAFTLAGTVIALWATVVVAVFWFTDMRWWRPLSAEELAVFNGEAIQQLPSGISTPGQISVIHFYDADCPCSRFTRAHLRELQGSLGNTRQFVFTQHDHAAIDGGLPKDLATLPDTFMQQWRRFIPASPAVGIWDGTGRLAYFGPYSAGPTCGSGASFVEAALNVLSRGENPHFINTDATGCFCGWYKNDSR